MKKTLKSITSLLLALILTVGVLSLSSCAPPKLEEVKDEFIRLIKESYAINEILFGEGLSGYGNLDYDSQTGIYYTYYYTKTDGRLCAYRDTENGRYVVLRVSDADGEGCVYKNDEKGIYMFPTELEYDDANPGLPDTPYGYRHVREEERCTSINEIATLASTVYSEDYLSDIFTIIFGDSKSIDSGSTHAAKYIEMTDDKSGERYLLCADRTTVPPIFEEIRIYDYSSMTIAKRSRRNYVNISIKAYGTFADVNKGEVVEGWHNVTLSFVRQGGEWRLDSPTY